MSEKRTKIIESAYALFAEKGFDATSTTSITNEANVGTGTLFKYFKNKEALLFELYDEAVQSFMKFAFSETESETSLKVQFKNCYEKMIEWTIYNSNAYSFIQQFNHSPLYLSNKQLHSKVYSELNELIKKAIDEEYFIQESIGFIREIILSQVAVVFFQHIQNEMNIETAQQRTFKLLWQGLLT